MPFSSHHILCKYAVPKPFFWTNRQSFIILHSKHAWSCSDLCINHLLSKWSVIFLWIYLYRSPTSCLMGSQGEAVEVHTQLKIWVVWLWLPVHFQPYPTHYDFWALIFHFLVLDPRLQSPLALCWIFIILMHACQGRVILWQATCSLPILHAQPTFIVGLGIYLLNK
jgi:hypothetical protein